MAMWNPWRGCHRYSEGCKFCYIHKGDAKRGVDTNQIIRTDDFYKPIARKKNGEYKMKSGLVAFPTEKAKKAEKAYYIRKMSNSIRANALEEKELILLTNNQPYDDRANLMARVEDMKSSLISEFLHTVGSDLHSASLRRPVEEIATSMRLIGGPSEMRRPLNVGLMFFNEQPESFFTYARIEVVDKPDPTGIGIR